MTCGGSPLPVLGHGHDYPLLLDLACRAKWRSQVQLPLSGMRTFARGATAVGISVIIGALSCFGSRHSLPMMIFGLIAGSGLVVLCLAPEQDCLADRLLRAPLHQPRERFLPLRPGWQAFQPANHASRLVRPHHLGESQ